MEKYLVSALKYRPSTFSTVVGQKSLTTTLKNAVAAKRLAHSYLFCGSRGVGKTSCARIFAKTINCLNPTADGEACNECASCRAFNEGTSMNIIELDAASNNGVDDMRALIEQVQVPPSTGNYRVFIIDEVHMLSQQAFNAFLKTLEEPPSYVIFILATTEKHKIIPTILSRCQIFDFHRITIQDMVDHLAMVAEREGIAYERSALNVIASKAEGAMRDALSIFDQVAASSGRNITYASAIENLNVLDHTYYHRLLDVILAGDILQSWLIYKEIRDNGFDSLFFINGLASYMRDLMVARDPSTLCLIEATDEVRQQYAAIAAKCTPEFLYRAMNLCNEADLNFRTSSNKQFLIELTLAKLCQLLSPSPSNSGNGEGQLKPIAAPDQAKAAPAAAPVATPAVAPKPVATPVTPPVATPVSRPAAAQAPRPSAPAGRPSLRTPKISINHSAQQQEQSAQTPASNASARRTAGFNPHQLSEAWNAFIAENPKAHILVNTMRASQPADLQGNTFTVTVQNQMQAQLMHESRPQILASLHDRLSNDMVDFIVNINADADPRHTLSEKDLLDTMTADYPHLGELISTLNLRLS
ncbi:MAG: DNA polymerase III subunit gamma/tau [Paramuribaculum sp.]|nr:DNA polymerase III subunit gamma/tau [Paramuribaculum sp.]